MFKSRLHFIAGILIAALPLLVGSCTGYNASGSTQNLQGVLGKIDSISGDVTVILNDGSAVEFNFKNVNVENIREAPGNVALETGSVVTVTRGKDGKVTDLKTHAADIEGIIKSVGTNKKAIVITLDTKGQLSINVTGTTSIVFTSGDLASFIQLVPGQTIEVIYDITSKNALKIEINQPGNSVKVLKGKIIEIDSQAKTISVQDETGAITPPLHVTPSSKLFVDRTSTFESLFADMEVKVKFNPETHELLKLEGKDLRAPIERFLEKNQ